MTTIPAENSGQPRADRRLIDKTVQTIVATA